MSYADVKIKSNSVFLKIEAGEPKDIRLLDDPPREFLTHDVNKNGKFESLECPGETCSYCKEDHEPPKQKFITNVYEHGAKRVLLYEYGGGVAKQLKSIAITLSEEEKSIMDVDLKIEATGSNKAKRYAITPRMAAKQVPGDLKKLALKREEKIPF